MEAVQIKMIHHAHFIINGIHVFYEEQGWSCVRDKYYFTDLANAIARAAYLRLSQKRKRANVKGESIIILD